MNTIFTIHQIMGERVLPLVTVLAAIWLTVRWRPAAKRDLVARFFPILIHVQVLLGLIYFVYRIASGDAANLLAFPFLLHPVLGFLAAGIASMAMRPGSFASRFGRWTPLITLGLLLVIVVANVAIAMTS